MCEGPFHSSQWQLLHNGVFHDSKIQTSEGKLDHWRLICGSLGPDRCFIWFQITLNMLHSCSDWRLLLPQLMYFVMPARHLSELMWRIGGTVTGSVGRPGLQTSLSQLLHIISYLEGTPSTVHRFGPTKRYISGSSFKQARYQIIMSVLSYY